ncbi:variant surface glycoprotein [Trypanosoma brucei equiperdum]|uniref:Variant surface glycoprotein n=1 Tax=Trypanosoma brucei equiperdum TaxID=630700 RepID=A0A3L6L9Y1_9TRYP|nr:variant surface glycoprotein [Trypanosoma brucei equiperdum]
MAKQFEKLYAALLLFFTLKTLAAEANQEETAANEAAATICTIDAYYEAISGELESWLTQLASATEALTAQQQLLALAAVKSTDEAKKRAYMALGQIVQAKIKRNVDANERSAPPILKAVETINRRRAEQAVSAGAMADMVITESKHTAAQAEARLLTSDTGANTRICTANATTKPRHKLKCSNENEKIAEAGKISKALHSLKQLVTYTGASIATQTTAVVVETVGDTTGQTWAAGHDNKHCDRHSSSPATAAATKTGLGVASLTITTGATRQTLNIEETRSSRDADKLKTNDGERQTITSDKELVSALYAAIKAKPATARKLTSESLTELAAEPIAISIYNYLTNPGAKLPTQTPAADKVAQLIFGKSKGDVGTEFLKPLESDSNSIPTSDKPITGPTTKISAENYNEAMAYYTALNLKKTAAGSGGDSPKEDTEKKMQQAKKKKRKTGIKKTRFAQPLKKANVTRQSVIGTQKRKSAKLRRELLLIQL